MHVFNLSGFKGSLPNVKGEKASTFSVLIECARSSPPHASTCPLPVGMHLCGNPLCAAPELQLGCPRRDTGRTVAGTGRAQGQPCPLSEEGVHPRAPTPLTAWGWGGAGSCQEPAGVLPLKWDVEPGNASLPPGEGETGPFKPWELQLFSPFYAGKGKDAALEIINGAP